MVMMAGMDEHERKVVVEFCHLLEKSKQLFNGLRDLPQYGHKQWQAYFGRTFDIYTKLWKFQQQHRAILDSKYGLKRWQIGEIASKIGQLYYHYYLRTSETSYLHEAYSFYAAIRGRAYYSRAAKEDRSDLMVKKLRYYARFIVVCLLLNKMKLVRELVQELDAQIADYSSTYEPDDQVEWNLVLEEIKAFVKAESALAVLHAESNAPVVLTHRLGALTSPPVERSPPMCLSLQEILIVGNCAEQVKFSELSMDMFRMLQTLEREPRDDPNHLHDASPAGRMPFRPGPYPPENGAPRRENPHKYLLYKPTYSQVQVFLASGFKELPANGALLLYLSADGCFSTVKRPEEMGYDLGGVSTSAKREPEHKGSQAHGPQQRLAGGKEPHCLYPGDLYPFTRKPLFVVVDSDNSFVFQQVPRYFGQPLMVLMSPQETPPSLRELRHAGSLFTLFLHSPLAAFCLICNVASLPIQHWERCQRYVEQFLIEASRLVLRSRCGNKSHSPILLYLYDELSSGSNSRDSFLQNRACCSSSATTSCGCCCCATSSATWCCTCTARSAAGSRGRAVSRRCPRPSCWSTPRSTTWSSTWPPASTRATTSRTATSSPDPGDCRLRSTLPISTGSSSSSSSTARRPSRTSTARRRGTTSTTTAAAPAPATTTTTRSRASGPTESQFSLIPLARLFCARPFDWAAANSPGRRIISPLSRKLPPSLPPIRYSFARTLRHASFLYIYLNITIVRAREFAAALPFLRKRNQVYREKS